MFRLEFHGVGVEVADQDYTVELGGELREQTEFVVEGMQRQRSLTGVGCQLLKFGCTLVGAMLNLIDDTCMDGGPLSNSPTAHPSRAQ